MEAASSSSSEPGPSGTILAARSSSEPEEVEGSSNAELGAGGLRWQRTRVEPDSAATLNAAAQPFRRRWWRRRDVQMRMGVAVFIVCFSVTVGGLSGHDHRFDH